MSATALLARKELRALSVLWLAIAASMLAGGLPLREVRDLGPLFYVFGALALGADAIGHELRHGTLTPLLMQPVRRSRILGTKMAVLGALLLAAAAVAATVVFPQFRWYPADRPFLVALFVLPVAYGFLVAPWLTLATRSTLAGTLFSGSLGVLLLLGGTWLGTWRFERAGEVDATRLLVLWGGSAVLCLCGAVGLWRSFARLQVTEGAGADITLPRLSAVRAPTARRSHPLRLLAAKELRLQQLTLVVPVIYVLLLVTLWLRPHTVPGLAEVIAISTTVHGMLVAALAGAFACAEERALGTLPSQLLQPIAARAQFAIKVAVTAALALAVAIGLPAAAVRLLGLPPYVHASVPPIGMLLLVLAIGVFISSVSGSALVAFFLCVPTFLAVFWFVHNIAARAAWSAFQIVHGLPRWRSIPGVPGWMAALADGGLALLVLVFAFENYRNTERSAVRVAGQVLRLAAVLVVASIAFGAAGRLLFW